MSRNIIENTDTHEQHTRTYKAHYHISYCRLNSTSYSTNHNETAGSYGIYFDKYIGRKDIVGIYKCKQ